MAAAGPRCYLGPSFMRRVSLQPLLLAMLLTAACPVQVGAQLGLSELDVVAEDDTEIVVEEPVTPDRETVAHDAELLDELLSRAAEETIREKKFAAAAGIMGGTTLIGLAVWRLVEEQPTNQYTRGLGVMFMTLGMADLTTGVFAAVRIPHEKHRLERWRRARLNGISAMELARFEGELQSAHETRQGERLLVRWNGLTHALAGILTVATVPIPASLSRTDRVSGYVIGGIFVFTGSAAFGLSFRKSPSEKAWLEYQARKAAPGHELSLRIAPAFSRHGLGVSVLGRF